MNATEARHDKPGYVLRNGAILLASKELPSQGNESVVLGMAPGTFLPYCVWRRTRSESLDITWSGEYFADLSGAWRAFEARQQ